MRSSAEGSALLLEKRKTKTQQSHITLKAVKVLAEGGIVEDEARKKVVVPLFQVRDFKLLTIQTETFQINLICLCSLCYINC